MSDADFGRAQTPGIFRRRWLTPITVSLALVALATVIVWPVQARLKHEHLIFIYLVPTSLIAIRYGSISAMGATIVSSIAAAYFMYPPQFSFLVASPLDLLELTLFCLLALLASQVVSGFANDGEVVQRRPRTSTQRSWRRRPLIAALLDRVRLR